MECQFKIAILKTDVANYIPIAMALRTDEPIHQDQKVQNLHKNNYNEKAIDSLKQRLPKIIWENLKKCENPNEVFNHFFEKYIYEKYLKRLTTETETAYKSNKN